MEHNITRDQYIRNGNPGAFPLQRLKRVDKPTTEIPGSILRVKASEAALSKAARGEYGPKIQHAFLNESQSYPLCASMYSTIHHLAAISKNPVAPMNAEIPDDPEILSLHIKSAGYFYQADMVGICEIPNYAVYSHDVKGNPIELGYQYAIVLLIAKDYGTMYASNGRDYIAKSIAFDTYHRLALITQAMANYIRRLGYPAEAEHLFCQPKPDNYRVLLPPLILWSGLGEASRAGIVVNPFLGLGYKAAAVLTNMPLIPDKPIDFGLQDFCRQCGICAEMCPSKSIPTGGKILYNGRIAWKLDEERCARFFIANTEGSGCNVCVKVCPWTRPASWNHNLVRWAVERSGLARKLAITADLIRKGHRSGHYQNKWWFDNENYHQSST